jgi:RNA polymerase primary sigma factor
MTEIDDSLRLYLKEIADTPVLTRQEEIDVFKRLKRGDKTAREEIIRSNLRFVVKIALEFVNRGMPLADLIQEGNVGLLEVINKYDYRKGFRFSTYAAFWIRQAIQIALRKTNSLIRLPIRKSRFLGKLNDIISNFAQREGREPTTEELARETHMKPERLEALLNIPARGGMLSLDRATDPQDDPDRVGAAHNMGARIPDSTTKSPVQYCMENQAKLKVEKMLQMLSEREKTILRLRYGFESGKNMSLRKASTFVGLSQEGVRRVEMRALSKLRRPSIRAYAHGLL